MRLPPSIQTTTSSDKDVDEHGGIFFCNERVDVSVWDGTKSLRNIDSCDNYVCVALAN